MLAVAASTARCSRDRIHRSSTRRCPPGASSVGVPVATGYSWRRVQQHQPRGVPHLVRQVVALLDALGAVADVLGRGHREQAEADARRRRGRRSRPAGRCRCRGSSTSAGRRGPGSPGGRRRRGTGCSPANSIPIITMRATQRKMISRAVVRKRRSDRRPASSGVSSGQPRTANGHSAELNQVSSTSSSWRSSPPHAPHRSGARLGDVGLLAGVAVPDRNAGGPTRAGARCTRAGCSASSRGRPACSSRGRSGPRRARRPRSPGAASSSIRRTTAGEISGSIRSPERSENGTECA